jgi:hypothetical protein
MSRVRKAQFIGGRQAQVQGAFPNPYPNPDYLATGALPTFPFPNSIFTQPVPSSPVLAPNSQTLVTNFNNQWTENFDDIEFNYTQFVPARYVVHGNQFPWQSVSVNPNKRWNAGDPSGIISAPIPPNATPDPAGTDHQLVIWNLDPDPVTGLPMYWEFWGADIRNGWECNTMVRAPTNGSFSGVYPWSGDPSPLPTSAGAARISYAGQVTMADVLYGQITHALNVAVVESGSFVAPANQHDGSPFSSSVPEGTRFYFPPGVTMPSGLPVFAQMAFHAIQTYGIYVMDGAGSVVSYLEHELPWLNYQGTFYPTSLLGSPTYLVSNNLPWSQLVALTPMSAAGIINGSTVPGAPTVSLTPGSSGSGQITVNWTTPGSAGTSAITGYAVYVGTASNAQAPTPSTTTGVTTSATLSLTSGTTYYVKVAAISAVGTGQASTEQNISAP